MPHPKAPLTLSQIAINALAVDQVYRCTFNASLRHWVYRNENKNGRLHGMFTCDGSLVILRLK